MRKKVKVAQLVFCLLAMSYAGSGGGNPQLLLSPDQGSSRPSAFINYILFDETYTPLDAKSQPVGTSANSLHQISLPTINVTQTGYLFVYLSYDNQSGGADVYFDEFKITYQESPVIQVNSYYPFGMTAFSWVREGESQNKYLYQGKEYETLTGLHDFHARQFDAALGRWFSADPAKQFSSPYSGMGNNPVISVDPDGKVVWLVPVGIGMLAGAYSGAKIAEQNGEAGNPLYFYGGAVIGGAAGYAGSAIAASGIPFANTAAVVASSTINSVGMSGLDGWDSPITTSFGAFSVTWENGDLGYLGKSGSPSKK